VSKGGREGVQLAQRNIKLVVAYEGTKYHGWQRQTGQTTIQAVLEREAQRIVGHRVKIIGAGRTDAGVHALGQVCNFLTDSSVPIEGLRKGLNALLPDDIYVVEASDVPLDFHARYSAKTKTYVYRILNRIEPDIFARRYLWHIPLALDVAVMSDCLAMVQGTHDFSCFRSSGSSNRNPVRTLFRAEVSQDAEHKLTFLFEADGFLRHMVRNIVGTVVGAGLGKIDKERFQHILASKDRTMAGKKAPPQGLFLVKVTY